MNLEAENRCGHLVTSEMKRVWQCQLDILSAILDICRRHDLKVFADGGTLIGAIRHHGFIPWDDDIDLGMPRADYDRFCEIATRELPPNLFLQSILTDGHYFNRFIKVVDKTTLALPRVKNSDGSYSDDTTMPRCCPGIFVDIFPYDLMPNTPRGMGRLTRHIRRKQTLLKITQRLLEHLPDSLYAKWRPDRQIFSSYERKLRSFASPDSRYMTKVALHLREFIYDTRWFDHIDMVDFEDIKIPVPAGYDDILRLNYGDYMTPVKAPSGHAPMKFLLDTGSVSEKNFQKK